MLRAGLIGIGGMGRGHLDNYIKFEKDTQPVQLVAICDIDEAKFKNYNANFNIDGVGKDTYDFSKYNCYTDVDEMLEKEQLDMVSVIVPTYAHSEVAIKVLNKGIHVISEKPMALNTAQCQQMIDTAKANNKKLMIAQCLRFWGEYELLKEYVQNEKLGKVISAYFFRGGGTPDWSYQDWMLKRALGGGAIFDLHVHDADMVSYLFGKPTAVQSLGRIYYENSGYDAVTTNYIYDDQKVVNAQSDWTLSGSGFGMIFRVNFEQGTIVLSDKGLKVAIKGGEEFVPEFDKTNAYYKETVYFANAIINDTDLSVCLPESAMQTISIIEAEVQSCDEGGTIVNVK